MKYSIIIPYYNRESLEYTLNSFVKYYLGRLDYEVIIVEGKKNSENPNFHTKLLEIISKFEDKISIKYLQYNERESFNPAGLFNFGFKNSIAEIIVLTSPECYHEVDILKGFDEEFKKDENIYVVCGCQAIKLVEGKTIFDKWYQHSLYMNRLLHFCTTLTRKNFYKIGGFDENYMEGIAYEDDDFREKILSSHLKLVLRDDLLVSHINHDTEYQQKNFDLTKLNEIYYRKKWHKEEVIV